MLDPMKDRESKTKEGTRHTSTPSWGPAVQEAVDLEQAKVMARWPGPRLETIALVRRWLRDGLIK